MTRFRYHDTPETNTFPWFKKGFEQGVAFEQRKKEQASYQVVDDASFAYADRATRHLSEDTWEGPWEQYMLGFVNGFYTQQEKDIPRVMDQSSFSCLLNHAIFHCDVHDETGTGTWWVDEYCSILAVALQRYIRASSDLPLHRSAIVDENDTIRFVTLSCSQDLHINALGVLHTKQLLVRLNDVKTVASPSLLPFTKEGEQIWSFSSDQMLPHNEALCTRIVAYLTNILGPFDEHWLACPSAQ